jgi:lipopolysaccharide export system protein LptA
LKKIIWTGSLLLALLLPLWAQGGEKLRVIHSDKLFLSKNLDEQVMRLEGSVHFWYGPTEFKCDRAMIFDLQKIARLDGNVKVSNDSLFMSSDSLAYYRTTEELNAGGKVYIEEAKQDGVFRWFRSDYAIYNQMYDNLTVWSNVSSFDKQENASITCGYAYWDRKLRYAYMIENPEVRTAGIDSLYVKADKIEFFDEERKLAATFNVLAQSQDYQATSDFLIYFMSEDKAVFTGQPVFHSDYADARAKEFYLFFQDRQLTRAELVDSCRVDYAEEQSGPRINWVLANYISIAFKDKQIREFQAENTVRYHYRQDETEERDFFVNTANGDYLEAKFNEDNKLDYMKMNRGIKGTYKFHNNS